MEIRVILRGALAGFIAGLLGFAFARVFAEPVLNQALIWLTVALVFGGLLERFLQAGGERRVPAGETLPEPVGAAQ